MPGTACQFVCSGKGDCGGLCKPADKRCSPTTNIVPETCSEAGQWVAGATLPEPVLQRFLCRFLHARTEAVSRRHSRDVQPDGHLGARDALSVRVLGRRRLRWRVQARRPPLLGNRQPTTRGVRDDRPVGSRRSGLPVRVQQRLMLGQLHAGFPPLQQRERRVLQHGRQLAGGTGRQFVCTGQGTCSGECQPGARECSGLTVRACGSDGRWNNEMTCPFLCRNAGCAGTCKPGDRRCNGNNVQTCRGDASGYDNTQSCPVDCDSSRNACRTCGEQPARICDGQCVSNTDPEQLRHRMSPDAQRRPTPIAACSANGRCNFNCPVGLRSGRAIRALHCGARQSTLLRRTQLYSGTHTVCLGIRNAATSPTSTRHVRCRAACGTRRAATVTAIREVSALRAVHKTPANVTRATAPESAAAHA